MKLCMNHIECCCISHYIWEMRGTTFSVCKKTERLHSWFLTRFCQKHLSALFTSFFPSSREIFIHFLVIQKSHGTVAFTVLFLISIVMDSNKIEKKEYNFLRLHPSNFNGPFIWISMAKWANVRHFWNLFSFMLLPFLECLSNLIHLIRYIHLTWFRLNSITCPFIYI